MTTEPQRPPAALFSDILEAPAHYRTLDGAKLGATEQANLIAQWANEYGTFTVIPDRSVTEEQIVTEDGKTITRRNTRVIAGGTIFTEALELAQRKFRETHGINPDTQLWTRKAVN